MSNNTDDFVAKLRAWSKDIETPFTLDEAAASLGIDPAKVSHDLGTRLASALRKAGCTKVAYRAPYSNQFNQVRWIADTWRTARPLSWRPLPPPARAVQGEHPAAYSDTARQTRLAIALGRLPIDAGAPADKAPAPAPTGRLQCLAQWLAAVGQWFRSFPTPGTMK